MKRILILSLLILLVGGCLPRPDSTGLSDEEIISTLVAGTLAAVPDGDDGPAATVPPVSHSASETPAPAQPTLEPTATITFTPSPTFTLTPTITQTPTKVAGDPVLSLGMPTFDDHFNSGTNFYLYEDSQASYQIEDDQMVMIAKKANSYETWSLSWGDITDFYLEATGTFGADCSGRDRYGMIFRAPDTSQGYLITLSCNGAYRLSTWESEDEDYTVLTGWSSTSHANTGPGATNRLGIMVKNTRLTGYVNGHQVFELDDSTFSEGRMGVLVAASDTPGFTAYLTRVAYWNLP